MARTLADVTRVKAPSDSVLAAPWPYLLAGAIILVVAGWALWGGSSEAAQGREARTQAQRVVGQLSRVVQEVQEMLRNDAVQALAEQVREGESLSAGLLAETRRLIPEVTDVHVYGTDVFMMELDAMGENGFIMLDMMAAAEKDELSPVQFIEDGGLNYVAGASSIGRAVQEKGFLLVYLDPAYLLNLFTVADPAAGYIGLEHATGANAPIKLKEIGAGIPAGYRAQRITIPGSMLQVVFPASREGAIIGRREQGVLFILGALLLLFGIVRHLMLRRGGGSAETMPEQFVTQRDDPTLPKTHPPTLAEQKRSETHKALSSRSEDDHEGAGTPAPKQPEAPSRPTDKRPTQPASGPKPAAEKAAKTRDERPSLPPNFDRPDDPPLVGRISQPATLEDEELPPSLRPSGDEAAKTEAERPVNDAADKAPEQEPDEPPSLRPQTGAAPAAPPADAQPTGVALTSGIFRAYDIRGVVGETLDRGVAYQIGQAVGSLAEDSLATPVVVGRDGRHSGPELVDGLVAGIRDAGCDVVDVGAVPTGALYFAAFEHSKGTGVMVTGSHNPPDYNGFKIMMGGRTLAGNDIFGLFERIRTGELHHGQGEMRQVEVLEAYRERIAGDISLHRPLKVVADCGNGIGGACAADVLRAIGAEVVSLYDEVDGDFPNHHPDPSEPDNLEDLIDSVRITDADLGVAFDGDADRLGVVIPGGDIVYSDRIMMLYAREVLGRHPGATIIYDVKCTGHLEQVIREAGGRPEMYKTGHSLIKNRMKEVDAPFAGEMSGHFFFKDRWYGFDCGIYAACRLLEILAREEASPKEVLGALPNSVSTPELKVQMTEGENHAFIKRFQQEADFPGARLTTIDGVRADFDDGWGLVRASNTTPILVLRFDADSEEALERVQEAFRTQLLALQPDLKLPF